MNKFGVQCQLDSADAERYNRELQPTAVMVINVAKREFLQRLKADNFGVKLIYRHHPNYDWRSPTPEEAARRAVADLKAEIGHLLDLLDYVTDNNEYILSRDHMAEALIAEGDRYMAAFIAEARRELGLGTCWGNFNTGHWGAETVDYFPLALTAAEADGDSPICFHEYNWPEIPDAGHWTCGKVLRAMPPILEKHPGAACMITEFGVDDGGDPHKGWRLAHDDFGTAAAMFCQGVRWYKDDVVGKAPWLRAVLFFGCGMVSPWESFDIAPIVGNIKEALAASPPEEPPTEEPTMEIKVYDMDGMERDFAYAVEKYGVAFRRADAAPDQIVCRLVELREKTGAAALVTKVVDIVGKPIENLDVAFYWPEAPDPPDPPTQLSPHDWHRNFVHGPTNVNGDVGPGMGPGAYHGRGEGGPHAVWVRNPDVPSDICEKLGMLAGTFHDHLDQKFQLEAAGGGEPPEVAEVYRLQGEPTFQEEGNNRILLVAVGGSSFYETRASMGVVGSDWEIGPEHPESTAKYALCADYTPGEGETERTFWVRLEDPQGQSLGGPWHCRYETGRKGWWTLLLSKGGGEPEPPPPEPPAGEDRQRLYQMAAELKGIADRWPDSSGEFTEMALVRDGVVERCYALTPKAAGALSGLRAKARGLAAKLGIG